LRLLIEKHAPRHLRIVDDLFQYELRDVTLALNLLDVVWTPALVRVIAAMAPRYRATFAKTVEVKVGLLATTAMKVL